jgi:hypothetical protein
MRRLTGPRMGGEMEAVREAGGMMQPSAMPVLDEKCAGGLVRWCGFAGKTACRGESWKRVAVRAEGSVGGLSQGLWRKAPRIMERLGAEGSGVEVSVTVFPLIRRRVDACHDMTRREKELSEVPWLVVE